MLNTKQYIVEFGLGRVSTYSVCMGIPIYDSYMEALPLLWRECINEKYITGPKIKRLYFTSRFGGNSKCLASNN